MFSGLYYRYEVLKMDFPSKYNLIYVPERKHISHYIYTISH